MRFYYDERGYHNPSIIYDILNDSGYMGAGAWKTVKLPDGTEKKFNSIDTFIELFEKSNENRLHFISMMKDCFNKNMNFGMSQDEDTAMPVLESE
jgi:superoxide dismutase